MDTTKSPEWRTDQQITLTQGSGEPLRITNFRSEIPGPTSVKDRSAMVKAGLASDLGLDEDSLHGIARSVTNPAAAASVMRQGLLTSEVIGPVDASLLAGHVFLTELFVLLQPRAGGFAYSVDGPRVTGTVTDDSVSPRLELTFRDEDHLRAFIVQTVAQTKLHGTDYASSILAKRVSRPVLAHTALIRFEDGAESFIVLMVRDGITRVVSSWSAQRPELTPALLGDHIADNLLSSRVVRSAGATETMARARGREQVAGELRARFAEGAAGATPSEDAVRIGQTFTLPAQIVVGIDEIGESHVAKPDRFEDAVQGVIASIHGEFKPWETTATQSAYILRALPRAVYDDAVDSKVAEIATGARGIEDMPVVFGEDAPATALWRAIYLLCWLGTAGEWTGLKRHLRELIGTTQIRNRAYVSHLATLVDIPWRHAKVNSERQARRAWANGGALPGSFLGHQWDPVPVVDFLELVEPALDGDDNARRTLQVGGGVALIADKLLLSNVGSALQAGTVPFRADVDTIIEGLGRTEYGLCLLAHAANAFDPERQALNSYTSTELNSTPEEVLRRAYVVPRPARGEPRRWARDKAGETIRLRPFDVVAASDPDRAAEAAAKSAADEDRRKSASDESKADRVVRLRSRLAGKLTDAVTSSDELVQLASDDASILGGAFGSADEYARLEGLVRRLQFLLLTNEPAKASNEPSSGTSDEDADASLDVEDDGAEA